jgi:outer membrane protein assembly factor BamD (BamD/ComL family)
MTHRTSPGRTLALSLVFAAAAALLLLASCATQTAAIPDGLSAEEIFQRAQDAVDRGNYSLGMTYYSLVQEKYPDDTAHGVWASYEIAFLYHKMGKNETALSLVDQLLDKYGKEGDALPPAPRVLAQKLKARLEANSKKKP